MTAAQMAQEGGRLSKLLDDALRFHSDQVKAAAKAEQAYRHSRQMAYLQVTGTVDEKKADVDAKTADLRFTRDVAEGLRQTALEAIRSRRAQISLLQSVANAYKAEADFDRMGEGVAA